MSLVKVGNRFLDEQQYEDYRLDLWRICLFAVGAVLAGLWANGFIPAEWSKEMRFTSLISIAGFSGGIAAMLAPVIRHGVSMLLCYGAIFAVLCFVWEVI